MKLFAEALCYRVGGATLVDGVSLTVGPGELVGLIGPNGAGKTTLLRLLAGLLEPSGGRLQDDQPMMDRQARARRLAYLAQGAAVHWSLSVERVVALGRLPHGGDRRDRAAVEAALRATGVEALRHRDIATLSGGERLRVLLARALAVEAELLLADEPVAALDPYHQLQVMDLLRSAVDRGLGVVMVLHDLTLAARFCDRVVLLKQGRVLAEGPPDSVLSDENLALAYGVTTLRGDGARRYIIPWARIERT